MRPDNKNLIDYIALGKRIKDKRTEREMTQKDLAELANIDEAALGNYERGTKRIGLTSLVLIANVLDVNVDYLLFGKVGNRMDLSIEDQRLLANLNGCNQKQKEALLLAQGSIIKGFK